VLKSKLPQAQIGRGHQQEEEEVEEEQEEQEAEADGGGEEAEGGGGEGRGVARGVVAHHDGGAVVGAGRRGDGQAGVHARRGRRQDEGGRAAGEGGRPRSARAADGGRGGREEGGAEDGLRQVPVGGQERPGGGPERRHQPHGAVGAGVRGGQDRVAGPQRQVRVLQRGRRGGCHGRQGPAAGEGAVRGGAGGEDGEGLAAGGGEDGHGGGVREELRAQVPGVAGREAADIEEGRGGAGEGEAGGEAARRAAGQEEQNEVGQILHVKKLIKFCLH